MQLGDFELTFLSDGNYFLDGGVCFGVVPKVLWQKHVQADEQNRVVIGLNSVLVRDGKKNILIETGIGNKLPPKVQQIYQSQAKLLDSLKAAGVKPAEIDVVINSHLHFDHCGWNTVLEGDKVVPTFPNAAYYAPQGEWEAAQQQRERDAVSYILDNFAPLIDSGQMKLVSRDSEVLPGISMVNYPGHTPAMMAVMLESAGSKACYISDLIPTTAHTNLTWSMAFDLAPLDSIASKQRFYKKAIPEKWLVLFTHDPNIPCAHVETDGKRFGARAVEPR